MSDWHEETLYARNEVDRLQTALQRREKELQETQAALRLVKEILQQRTKERNSTRDLVRRMLRLLPSWLLKHPEDEEHWMHDPEGYEDRAPSTEEKMK